MTIVEAIKLNKNKRYFGKLCIQSSNIVYAYNVKYPERIAAVFKEMRETRDDWFALNPIEAEFLLDEMKKIYEKHAPEIAEDARTHFVAKFMRKYLSFVNRKSRY